jgi:hypothetical protein
MGRGRPRILVQDLELTLGTITSNTGYSPLLLVSNTSDYTLLPPLLSTKLKPNQLAEANYGIPRNQQATPAQVDNHDTESGGISCQFPRRLPCPNQIDGTLPGPETSCINRKSRIPRKQALTRRPLCNLEEGRPAGRMGSHFGFPLILDDNELEDDLPMFSSHGMCLSNRPKTTRRLHFSHPRISSRSC